MTGEATLSIVHSYAPGIVPQGEALKEGYSQNLWLYGKDHEITEVSGYLNILVL